MSTVRIFYVTVKFFFVIFDFWVIIWPRFMITKIIALQSEEVMILLTCLRIKISQDFSQVLDLASWERQYEAIVQLNDIECKLNI